MGAFKLLTFDEALSITPEKHRHLLLGNGFSRAWGDDVFSYGALLNHAVFDGLSDHARLAFDYLRTTDFETVMRGLQTASRLVELYAPSDRVLAQRLSADAEALREVLVRTIAGRHPDRPHDVSPAEFAHVKTFLAKFEDYYTLNYDLLLYWALMQSEVKPDIPFDDGFRTPYDGQTDYVSWEVENTNDQTVFYLHGALHVFDAGHEIQKYTWNNTQIALIDQIRAALADGLFPLFVAEGSSQGKYAKIRHSDFLYRARRSFSQIGGSLFVFGHSMDPNDEHIIRLIGSNKIKQLLVGLYGDPQASANIHIRTRCAALQQARPTKRPLEVRYYDASTARVWRD